MEENTCATRSAKRVKTDDKSPELSLRSTRKNPRGAQDVKLSFSCANCHKSFTNRRLFDKHAADCHVEDGHPAVDAPQQQQPRLDTTETVGEEESMACENCHKSFTNRRLFDKHVDNCHVQDGHPAIGQQPQPQGDTTEAVSVVFDEDDEGDDVDPGENSIPSRKRRSTTGPSIECAKCNRRFLTTKGRDSHECPASNEWPCTHCEALFTSKIELSTHLKTCKARSQVTCPKCHRSFVNRKNFERHPCAEKFGSVTCEECGKVFARSDSYKRHKENAHAVTNNHVCADCGKQFKSMTTLRDHGANCVVGQVLSPGAKSLTCPEDDCNANIRTYVQLCNHMQYSHTKAAMVKTLEFEDETKFGSWRDDMIETCATSWRVLYKRKGGKGSTIFMHVCNRSGRALDRSTGQRANWAKGYVRLDRSCTSFAHAQVYPNGRVRVEYCTDHTHEVDETSRSRPVISAPSQAFIQGEEEVIVHGEQMYDEATGEMVAVQHAADEGQSTIVANFEENPIESAASVEKHEAPTAAEATTQHETEDMPDIDVTNYEESPTSPQKYTIIEQTIDDSASGNGVGGGTTASGGQSASSTTTLIMARQPRFSSNVQKKNHKAHREALAWIKLQQPNAKEVITQRSENEFVVPSFEREYEAYMVTKLRETCEYGCKLRCGFHTCKGICSCIMTCSCTPQPTTRYIDSQSVCKHVHAVNILYAISHNDLVPIPTYYVVNGGNAAEVDVDSPIVDVVDGAGVVVQQMQQQQNIIYDVGGRTVTDQHSYDAVQGMEGLKPLLGQLHRIHRRRRADWAPGSADMLDVIARNVQQLLDMNPLSADGKRNLGAVQYTATVSRVNRQQPISIAPQQQQHEIRVIHQEQLPQTVDEPGREAVVQPEEQQIVVESMLVVEEGQEVIVADDYVVV